MINNKFVKILLKNFIFKFVIFDWFVDVIVVLKFGGVKCL